MKVNLLLKDKDNIRNGYTNIDPFADGSDQRIMGNVTDLTTEDSNRCGF